MFSLSNLQGQAEEPRRVVRKKIFSFPILSKTTSGTQLLHLQNPVNVPALQDFWKIQMI